MPSGDLCREQANEYDLPEWCDGKSIRVQKMCMCKVGSNAQEIDIAMKRDAIFVMNSEENAWQRGQECKSELP